jgi:hypothetical protein
VRGFLELGSFQFSSHVWYGLGGVVFFSGVSVGLVILHLGVLPKLHSCICLVINEKQAMHIFKEKDLD